MVAAARAIEGVSARRFIEFIIHLAGRGHADRQSKVLLVSSANGVSHAHSEDVGNAVRGRATDVTGVRGQVEAGRQTATDQTPEFGRQTVGGYESRAIGGAYNSIRQRAEACDHWWGRIRDNQCEVLLVGLACGVPHLDSESGDGCSYRDAQDRARGIQRQTGWQRTAGEGPIIGWSSACSLEGL